MLVVQMMGRSIVEAWFRKRQRYLRLWNIKSDALRTPLRLSVGLLEQGNAIS
jgi:hypothetical protein